MLKASETRLRLIAAGIAITTAPCEACQAPVEQLYANKRKRFCSTTCSNRSGKLKSIQETRARHESYGMINCLECGKSVMAMNSRGHLRKYCSPSCRSDARQPARKAQAESRRQEKIECLFCGNTCSAVDPVKGQPRTYCSFKCYREDSLRKKKIALSQARAWKASQYSLCANCLQKMPAYGKSGGRRKFCGNSCAYMAHVEPRIKAMKATRGSFSGSDWRKLKNRFAHCCAYCGEKQATLKLEHVVPVVRGGSHSIGNFLPVCTSCNSSKSKRTLMEWRVFLSEVTTGKRKSKLSPQKVNDIQKRLGNIVTMV